jgi:transposase
VRRPRDKAKVENAVGIVTRYVLGRLRNRRFFSLDELNAAVRECVTAINAKVMKRLNKSRDELFTSLDRPALKALPIERYSYAEWKRCTVAPDYHVEVDEHYYSVPFRLLRESIDARFTNSIKKIADFAFYLIHYFSHGHVIYGIRGAKIREKIASTEAKARS